METQKDIVIIGGGLAGLVNAIRLSSAGLNVLLIEKKSYPFHRVCGEYISNEALPFLNSIGADVSGLKPSAINRLLISTPSGSIVEAELGMGGFGLSRYKLDHHLYRLALSKGVEFRLNTQAIDIKCKNKRFTTFLTDGQEIKSNLVIGSFGKRSNLDRTLKRDFFYKRSPYIGVKYHIRAKLPSDQIALHNFKQGYCGISRIEDDKYCMCYLSSRENIQQHGNIAAMEGKILWKNPYLKDIFNKAEFLYEKPEVINEVSFEKKGPVENHILMSGDSAGMITPLCGNGMAMAIHSAKILSEIILDNYHNKNFDLAAIEKAYTEQWNDM
ncbi:MAG TPA: NAD(P)/FAD-dependent oxidoreductase, partial [Cytophagaceae bacterium]|nr:NAD(P)/FAD-dependent oxidoreductase [Cytophagaceae bacterium]